MNGDEILRHVVAEAAGFEIEALGEAAFTRSVHAAMARLEVASYDEYAAALRGSEAELQNLLEEMVVPETWFFRDRGPFEFLRDWARSVPDRSLRVLSAPCSTGEEPYSIAITLLEAGLAPDRFCIDAVDISRRALEAASRPVYGKSSFRELGVAYPDYFTAVHDGLAVRKNVAELVRFHCDNLVHPLFLRGRMPYDVVFCRNLLIYLGAEARRSVFRNLAGLIAPDGLVITGACELPVFVANGYTPLPYPYSFACRNVASAAIEEEKRRIERAAPLSAAAVASAAEAPLDTARRLADEGALEQALMLCEALPQDHPEHCYLKGVVYEALDRLDAAEECLRKALYMNPDHYASLLHMSALCERRGEYSRAGLFKARARRTAESGADLYEPRR